MPKKSNQKRSDGRIAVQVYLGRVDGIRKYKTVYGKTQKEANLKAEEIKAQLRKGLDISNSNTFELWAEHYLVLKRAETTETQYNTIKSRLDIWVESIGSNNIQNIRPVDLQAVLNRIAANNPYKNKPSSKKTVVSYMQIVRAVFDYAIDNRVIEYNPAQRLKTPMSASKEERRALTLEERHRIMEFEHRGKPAMMLMMFSGLRRGEATALLWSDIDFKRKTITVSKAYDFKQKTTKLPKNGKVRKVSIPTILVDYLKTLSQDSTFVITNAHGQQMTDDSWRRLMQTYLHDMNLKYGSFIKKPSKYAPVKIPMVIQPFTPHCLRHTFCTMMYEAGVDLYTAKEQMGHADVQTTLNIYTHLQKAHQEKNIAKLDDYLDSFAI